MDKKKIIFDFLQTKRLGVVSTVDEKGQPQSAVVEFGETSDLEIIFDTFSHARKYKNLQGNRKVSFVVGWDEDITVQYEGLAEELKGEELVRCKKSFFAKTPGAQKFEQYLEIKFFKVIPKWIRYSDLNTDPWTVFEVTF